MRTAKISDGRGSKQRRLRSFFVILTASLVTASAVLLSYVILPVFGIDPDIPIRQYDKLRALAGVGTMFTIVILMYGLSVKILSWIFWKLRI